MDVREKPEGASCCADRSRTPEPRHAWRHGTSSEPVPSPRLASVLAGFVLASLTLCAFPGNAHANICTRTAAVQTAILAKITGVSNCANVTSTHLASLRLLDLESQSITSLQAGDFSGLSSLTNLYLHNNTLSSLPTGVFDDLSSLTSLSLRNNTLSSLPTGVFDKLTSLTSLRLEHNQLSTLPTGVFDDLSSLRHLYLDNNTLSSLPTGVFDDLSSLTNLYLHNNTLSSLPTGVFDDLSSLRHLYLHNNTLSPLPSGVFDDLSSLESLTLANNTLSSLPTGVFDNLSSLRYLVLYNNTLSPLPTGVFSNLSSLEVLSLHNNTLSSLPTGVFDNLSSLRTLFLNNNTLSSLPTGVFSNLSSLENLYLYNNTLNSLPTGVFSNLSSLEILYLNNNTLNSLPTGVFSNLSSLETLFLNNNTLNSLPTGVFSNLSSLELLKLDSNNLSSLPTGVFSNLSSLELLWLGNNPGAPFTFTMEPERTGANTFEVEVVDGAPFTMTTNLTVTGGTLSASSVRVEAGSTTSTSITATPTGTGPVVVTLGPTVTQPPTDFKAIKTDVGGPLTLTPGVTVSKPSVTPGEDGSESYTVVLNANPTADVTIAVARATGGDTNLTVSAGASLTFTTTNWDSEQTVTIRATEDADGLNGTASFTHTATSADTGYAGISINSVAATEADNDTIGVTVSKTSVIPSESASEDYTVVLDTQPTADVTIAVAPATGGDTDLMASPTSLTFTTTNWDSEQTVTIAAAEDPDGLNGTASFTHTATSADTTYNTITIADVAATEADNDTSGVTVSKTSVIPSESASEDYTVVLDTQPTADVTIAVAPATGGDTDLMASPTSLTFTTTNWDSEQTVTIAAAEDPDGLNGTASFTHTATSADTTYNTITIADVAATEADNDTSGVTVSKTSVIPSESASEDYTVVLDTQPTADVTIAVAPATGGDTDLMASPTSLTFTTTNWDSEQTVTIAAAEDPDGVAGTASFTHTATSADTTYNTITIADVAATEADNDTSGVTVSKTSVTPSESASEDYRMKLNTTPTADVTIAVARATGGDTDLTVSAGASLTFTTTNWDSEQTVTIAAAEDADGLNGTASFTHTASSADMTYNGITIADVTATEADNDPIGVTVSKTSVTPSESASEDYTVVLDTTPMADVSIAVAPATGGDTDLMASPTSLTFTTTNWDSEQTVTIAAAEDPDGVAGTASFTHTASSADTTYDGITIADVAATEADNDTSGVTVSKTSVTPSESASEDYTVVLDTTPMADVSIAVAPATGGDTDLMASPTSLTFTTTNWDSEQTVTIAAAEDPDGVAGTASFTHTASSADTTYDGITIADVAATEADNDTIGVTVSKTSVTPSESASEDYTVVLDTTPMADVSIAVAPATGGDTDLMASPTSLTFTTTNWDSEQTVTIAAAEDPDGVAGTASFTHTASSADTTYDGITIADVAATEADNDPIGVTVDPIDGLTTTEAGDSDSFTVVLDTKPTAAVSIALSSSDPSEGAVVSASLTFTPDDWDKPHTVIVTGMDDAEVDGPQNYTVEFAQAISDDPNYNGFQPDDVKLTNMDDEGAAIRARFRRLNDEILSKQALTLADVTIAAVTSRMDAGACAGQPNTVSLGGSSTLAEILRANAQTLTTGRLNLKQLLGTSAFRLRLTEDGSGAGPGCLTLWGQGDYRNLSSGGAQALDWDGDLLTGQVGADALLRPDLRAGLAVSWSDGAFDYTDRTTGMPISGDYSSRMVSVHPYVTWWSPMGLDVWATGGYGRGEIEIEDEEVGTHSSDTTLRLASVGASGPLPIGDALIAGGTTTLRLKAQVSLAQMEVAGHGSLLQEQTIDAQRLRLALEGSHKRPLASGGSLTPSFEVGLRHDGGAGATGTGLELGGGLRYVDPALGLTIEGRGRVLAAYDDAYEEWGASGLIRLDPGAAGQGLSLSLVPSYGQTASGVQRLWDQGLPQGPTQGPSATQALTGRLEAEVGYGLTAFAGQGLVTPYSAVTLGGGTQQYRLGSRLELGPALRLSLEGTRQVTTVGQADQGIRLQADWRF